MRWSETLLGRLVDRFKTLWVGSGGRVAVFWGVQQSLFVAECEFVVLTRRSVAPSLQPIEREVAIHKPASQGKQRCHTIQIVQEVCWGLGNFTMGSHYSRCFGGVTMIVWPGLVLLAAQILYSSYVILPQPCSSSKPPISFYQMVHYKETVSQHNTF